MRTVKTFYVSLPWSKPELFNTLSFLAGDLTSERLFSSLRNLDCYYIVYIYITSILTVEIAFERNKAQTDKQKKKRTDANYDDGQETNVCAREKSVYVYLEVACAWPNCTYDHVI